MRCFNSLREPQDLLGLLVNQEKKVPQVFVVILVLMAVLEIEGQLGLLVALETRVTQGMTGSLYVPWCYQLSLHQPQAWSLCLLLLMCQ